MKKKATKTFLFLQVMLLLLLCSCHKTAYPPIRVPHGIVYLRYATYYTFDEAIEEASVIALIRIGSWLGENTSSLSTYYEADILKTYKGDPQKRVVIAQGGTSKSLFERNYLLFQAGNEFLLFLIEGEGNETHEAYYTILLDNWTLMDYVEDEKHDGYVVARTSRFRESISAELPTTGTTPAMRAYLYRDPIWETVNYGMFEFAYALADIEDYFHRQLSEGEGR